MTIEEFGQKIKTKYPEYATFSNADIGQKMLTKYPQYNSQIQQKEAFRIPGVTTAMEKSSDFLFGTTGKTVGGLITRGIGAVKQFTDKTPEGQAEAQRLQQVGEPSKTDIAFTALELFPERRS